MTEAEAIALLRRIKVLENLLEHGDCDVECVQADLDVLYEEYATQWLGG